MLRSAFVCLLIATSSPAGYCARIKKSAMNKMQQEEASEVAASSDSMQELELHRASLQGQVFRERYQLEEFLHSSPGPGYWPKVEGYRVNSYAENHINAGSFGDVWKALDVSNNKYVAVKLFYRRDDRFGRHKFLTWRTATRQEQVELKSNGKECQLVKDILKSNHLYPPGASHICECYAEHVTDAYGTDKPVFLVQELCGRDIQYNVIEKHQKAHVKGTPGDITKARSVTMQILQVLNFLQMFQTPLIHRDLKTENVNIVDDDVKVIDWGLTKFATPQHARDPPAGTPGYIPPESLTKYKAFDFPAHSFDTYSAGMIYLNLLCPDIPPPGHWNYKPPGQQRFGQTGHVTFSKAKIQQVLRQYCPRINLRDVDADVSVLMSMLDTNPSRRNTPNEIISRAPAFAAFRQKQNDTDDAPEEVQPDEGLYKVGTAVEYMSVSLGGWVPAVVAGYNTSSTYILNNPDGTLLHPAADPQKVRLREENAALEKGDKVSYESRWGGAQCGIIAKIYRDRFTGEVDGYELNHCSGYGILERYAQVSKVKRWKAQVSEALTLNDPPSRVLAPPPGRQSGLAPIQEEFQFKIGERVKYNRNGFLLDAKVVGASKGLFGEVYDLEHNWAGLRVDRNVSPALIYRGGGYF